MNGNSQGLNLWKKLALMSLTFSGKSNSFQTSLEWFVKEFISWNPLTAKQHVAASCTWLWCWITSILISKTSHSSSLIWLLLTWNRIHVNAGLVWAINFLCVTEFFSLFFWRERRVSGKKKAEKICFLTWQIEW